MSVQALSWVFSFSKSAHSARHVLLSIANHAKADGTGSWPSYERIAQESMIDRSTVRLALSELVELGELAIQSGDGPHGCNLYSLPKMKVGENYAQADLAASVGEIHAQTRREISPEPSLTVNKPSVCSACGATGVHRCPGHLNERQRAKRTARGIGNAPRSNFGSQVARTPPVERTQYKSWDQIRREEDAEYERALDRAFEAVRQRKREAKGRPAGLGKPI